MDIDNESYYRKLAHEVISEHLQTGSDMNKVVYEKAKIAKLEDSGRNYLGTEVNKAYLKLHGHKDNIEPVTPEKVASYVDSGYLSKVAYLYPEFNPSNIEAPARSKSASVEEHNEPFQLSKYNQMKIASAKLNKEYFDARNNFMAIQEKTASVFEKITQNMDFLKSYGFTADELVGKTKVKSASEGHLINSFYEQSKKTPSPNKLYKEVNEFTPHFNKLASLIKEFDELSPKFEQAQNLFFELDEKRKKQAVTVNV
jgi:hypothetical protein